MFDTTPHGDRIVILSDGDDGSCEPDARIAEISPTKGADSQRVSTKESR